MKCLGELKQNYYTNHKNYIKKNAKAEKRMEYCVDYLKEANFMFINVIHVLGIYCEAYTIYFIFISF